MTVEVVRTCPGCHATVVGVPYDIGSGPELSCAACETCFGADGQALNAMDPVTSFTSREECLQLLEAWYAWWRDSDEAPAKLPDALHIRTALVLRLSKIPIGQVMQ